MVYHNDLGKHLTLMTSTWSVWYIIIISSLYRLDRLVSFGPFLRQIASVLLVIWVQVLCYLFKEPQQNLQTPVLYYLNASIIFNLYNKTVTRPENNWSLIVRWSQMTCSIKPRKMQFQYDVAFILRSCLSEDLLNMKILKSVKRINTNDIETDHFAEIYGFTKQTPLTKVGLGLLVD